MVLETLLAGEVRKKCSVLCEEVFHFIVHAIMVFAGEVSKKCSVVSLLKLWNNVPLSPRSLGADHELPLKLDKSAVGLERGEGLGRGEEVFI